MSARRFWPRVHKTETCWLWTGFTDDRGYGRVWGHGKMRLAHRYALMLVGIDPGPLDVDHICHNTTCVRPDHLRPVTRKQNMENSRGASRRSKTGVRGVSPHSDGAGWVASVGHNYHLNQKYFLDFDEACAWVVAKRNELYTHNDVDRAAS